MNANGFVELARTAFQVNVAENGSEIGHGIINWGGRVTCIVDEIAVGQPDEEHYMKCLPVCTACRAVSPPPSPSPQPVTPTSSWPEKSSPKAAFLAGSVSFFLGLALYAMAKCWFGRRFKTCLDAPLAGQAELHAEVELGSITAPHPRTSDVTTLLETDHIASPHTDLAVLHEYRSESESLGEGFAQPVLPWSVMSSSPAPIFVVDCNMRVVLWSPGMNSSAPLLVDPVGELLLKLPFASAGAGTRFNSYLRQMFTSSAENTHAAMLHIQTKNGPVLLEMAATPVGKASGKIIVLVGREVDSGLAGLIHHGSDIESELPADPSRPSNSSPHDDDEDRASEISSLTAQTFDLREPEGASAREQTSQPKRTGWLNSRSFTFSAWSMASTPSIESVPLQVELERARARKQQQEKPNRSAPS